MVFNLLRQDNCKKNLLSIMKSRFHYLVNGLLPEACRTFELRFIGHCKGCLFSINIEHHKFW